MVGLFHFLSCLRKNVKSEEEDVAQEFITSKRRAVTRTSQDDCNWFRWWPMYETVKSMYLNLFHHDSSNICLHLCFKHRQVFVHPITLEAMLILFGTGIPP